MSITDVSKGNLRTIHIPKYLKSTKKQFIGIEKYKLLKQRQNHRTNRRLFSK